MNAVRRYFVPHAYYALLLILWAVIASVGVFTVSAVHRANADKREACRRAADVLVKRKPFLHYTVRPEDDCVYLRRLTGEDA